MSSTNYSKRSFRWFSYICSKLFGNRTKHCDVFNDVLFYGINDEERSKQIGLNNLYSIAYVIMQASKSIDVCVPSLVSETLANRLIAVQQKNNVIIRVIIHNSSDFHNLQPLAQNGIEVKVTNTTERLEHEFILIDTSGEFEDAVAVLGSLDYEPDRINCNRDATMLISEETVLTTLKTEFDRIWHQTGEFSPKTQAKATDQISDKVVKFIVDT